MKLVSYSVHGEDSFGLLTDHGVVSLKEYFSGRANSLADVLDKELLGEISDDMQRRDPDYSTDKVEFLRPIIRPGKIICVGINYKNRPGEYGASKPPAYPSLFLRTPGSLTAHGQDLIRPSESEQLDYEGEIALIIGKFGRRIREADAMQHVAGFACFNEGTIRDWVKHGVYNVTAGKNWESSGAIGPCIATADEVPDHDDMSIQTRVNGNVVQSDNTKNLMFPFPYLLSYISTFMELHPGDVIATGTPIGAGGKMSPPKYLKPDDVVEVEVSGVGVLRNVVADGL